jgi:hypothetical protein
MSNLVRNAVRHRVRWAAPARLEITTMAKVSPFHSRLNASVHHNNNSCTEGDNIESYNRVAGTGGLPLCAHCRRLG